MMIDIKTIIGQHIKMLREINKYSQKDLAYAADLDRSYIAGIENGQRNVSIINITKIAFAFNISLKEFFQHEKFDIT